MSREDRTLNEGVAYFLDIFARVSEVTKETIHAKDEGVDADTNFAMQTVGIRTPAEQHAFLILAEMLAERTTSKIVNSVRERDNSLDLNLVRAIITNDIIPAFMAGYMHATQEIEL